MNIENNNYDDLRRYIEKIAEQDKERVNEVLKNTDITDMEIIHIVVDIDDTSIPHCTFIYSKLQCRRYRRKTHLLSRLSQSMGIRRVLY